MSDDDAAERRKRAAARAPRPDADATAEAIADLVMAAITVVLVSQMIGACARGDGDMLGLLGAFFGPAELVAEHARCMAELEFAVSRARDLLTNEQLARASARLGNLRKPPGGPVL